MDCILLRHGIAVDRDEWDAAEAERPLTRKGAERTRQAVGGLSTLGVTPTQIVSSPLVRAMETAQIVREVCHVRSDIQVCDELLPDAPPEKLFPLLASLATEPCVVCVGHEPHLSTTAGVMVFGQPCSGLSLKKSGAACIRYDAEPRAGYGQLRWWLTPGQLRMIR